MRFRYPPSSPAIARALPANQPLYGKYVFLNLQKLSAHGIFLSV
jgi:hypothetical protein